MMCCLCCDSARPPGVIRPAKIIPLYYKYGVLLPQPMLECSTIELIKTFGTAMLQNSPSPSHDITVDDTPKYGSCATTLFAFSPFAPQGLYTYRCVTQLCEFGASGFRVGLCSKCECTHNSRGIITPANAPLWFIGIDAQLLEFSTLVFRVDLYTKCVP